ncbi:MAG: pyridoxal-phosphate dependent enzyme [Hungatella sp.]
MEPMMDQNCRKARNLLAVRPKAAIGFFPTPFYQLEQLSLELGINLYIKRDDFTGMNLFGGNKVRKLQYLIGDALQQGCEYVFTYGATQSNHAMQTVSACRRCGLKPVLYLVAIVKPEEGDARANLLLDQIMGAEIHIVEIQEGESEADAEARSYQMAREQMDHLEAEGHRCYDVPMGGASAIGSAGFIEGYVELEEQLQKLKLSVDYIFHATGTGGTAAGLAAGRKLVQSEAKIISINVSAKAAEAYRQHITDLANDSLNVIGAKERVNPEDIHTDSNYYLPGYEVPNRASTEAIKLLARREGLLIDPVYTGKAFAGMLDYIRSGKSIPGAMWFFGIQEGQPRYLQKKRFWVN